MRVLSNSCKKIVNVPVEDIDADQGDTFRNWRIKMSELFIMAVFPSPFIKF